MGKSVKKQKVITLNSFEDLSKACGLPQKQPKEQKPRKCFRCGGDMRQIDGTNVFLCTGTKKDKDGKEKQCMNRLIVNAKGV